MFWILILALTPTLQEENACDPQCQLHLVEEYFQLLVKVSTKGSTTEDIENLLTFCHDDVKYEHIEYEANFDKATWRKAFNRNLERGAYANESNRKVRILKHIHGKSHMAIDYAYGKINKDGSWQKDDPTKTRLMIVGFKDGKITLLREYW